MKWLNTFILLLLPALTSQAQKWAFGFKAGASYSSIAGPTEPNETVRFQYGIHIGPEFKLVLHPSFGLFSALEYHQGGAEYSYKGPGYFVFRHPARDAFVNGEIQKSYVVENAYIGIPIGIYAGPWKSLQIGVAITTNLLVSSTARGNMRFAYISPNGKPKNFEVKLDYNYFRDEPGQPPKRTALFTRPRTIHTTILQGIEYNVPEFLGAYYFYREKNGRLYKTFDFGWNIWLRYYLNDAFFVGLYYYRGFVDITNNAMDLRHQLDDQHPTDLPRSSDIDRNIIYRLTVGFSF